MPNMGTEVNEKELVIIDIKTEIDNRESSNDIIIENAEKLDVPEEDSQANKMQIRKNIIVNIDRCLVGKTILKIKPPGIELKSGQVYAVTGRSGCGKTTLIREIIRWIMVNMDERFKESVGYISQREVLYDELPLVKMLKYYAVISGNQTNKIDEVMRNVGLSASAKTKVKNLSGGQRRRAAFAMELLSEPYILFLDEPESGLDEATLNDILDLMISLKKEGKIIVCATHEEKIICKADVRIDIVGDETIVSEDVMSNKKRFV